MTKTQIKAEVRGATAGALLAIGLVAMIAMLASAGVTRAQTASTTSTTTNSALMNTRTTVAPDGTTYTYTAPCEEGASMSGLCNGTAGVSPAASSSTATNTNGTTGSTTSPIGGSAPSPLAVSGTGTASGTGSTTLPGTGTQPVGMGTQAQTAPLLQAQPLNAPAPMVVRENSNGSALIRGVVQSVNGMTITLASWGGTWTIQAVGSTTVIPTGPSAAAGTADLSGIMPGDFVGAAGIVSPNQAFTVNASVIRDWTKSPAPLGGTRGASNGNSTSTGNTTAGSSTSGQTSPGTTTGNAGSSTSGSGSTNTLY